MASRELGSDASGESVVAVEFGKEQRESARRMARLLDLVETRDQELLDNPKKYYDMACEEIVRLQDIVRAAQDALRPPFHWSVGAISNTTKPDFERWVVEKAEWERWREAIRIIEKADAK